MSNLTQYTYPFDPTGTAATNKVVNEKHVVSVDGPASRLIIPKHGPYFKESIRIRHVATGHELVPGVEFEYSLYFEAASNTEPYPSIFGGVSLLTSDYDRSTLELLEYQTIGGEHTLSESSIATMLANLLVDPRTTRWDDVTYKPGTYTPESHLTNLEETVGYGELVSAVRDLTNKYSIQTQQLVQLITAHMGDENDPHNVKGGTDNTVNKLRSDLDDLIKRVDALESGMLSVQRLINTLNDVVNSLQTDTQLLLEHLRFNNVYGGVKLQADRKYFMITDATITLPSLNDVPLGSEIVLAKFAGDETSPANQPIYQVSNVAVEKIRWSGRIDTSARHIANRSLRAIKVDDNIWEIV